MKLVSQLKDLIYLPIDFETYWDQDYSLDKLTNFEYVLDPRFEIIGCSYAQGFEAIPTWITADFDSTKAQLGALPWDRICVVAHNARFEASILEWKLGIKPAGYLCTMVGSRPHYVPYAGGAGLGQIADYLHLGKKGDFAKTRAKGKHRLDFNSTDLREYGDYCCGDTALGGHVGRQLLSILPTDERDLIDLTIKKYVRPKLRLDREVLSKRLETLSVEKRDRINYLQQTYQIGLSDIRSRTTFAKILGAELSKHGSGAVPIKINKKGNTTYAFSKDDIGFSNLLAHQSSKVRDLVGAKIAFGSTLEESRVTRLIKLHDLTNGLLPVPLVYYGAHPGRFSGDESINLQNLPRVVRDKSAGIRKGHLRFAIKAPSGYKIVAADLSNIEARLVATLAKQVQLILAFTQNTDVYASFATQIYGRHIDKNTDPLERFVGKTCILGLGYGMGWRKFQLQMAKEGIILSDAEAKRIVYLYRDTYDKIPQLWGNLENIARSVMTDRQGIHPSNLAGITFAAERIILPNNMPIVYPGLTRTKMGLGFRSRFGKSLLPIAQSDMSVNIWGGMFTENICQALARIILVDAELELAKLGIIAAHQVHDELIFVIPTQLVAQVIAVIESIMTRPKLWLPDLPIAVEIHTGDNYGECK